MKTIKVPFLIFASFLCLAFLAIDSRAQCVQCTGAPPGGFVCTGAAVGALTCTTDQQSTSCTVSGLCPPIIDRNGNSVGCAVKLLYNPQISVADSIIREIGATDTRLAIALLNVSRIKAEFTVARVSFTPVAYTFDDVENHLTQPAGSPYFEQLKKRVKEAFSADGNIITYDISITENRGNNSVSMSITPAGKAGAGVELALQRTTFGEGKQQSTGFKIISYQIR